MYLRKNRITDWGLKEPVEIIFLNPMVKQRHLQLIVQNCVQTIFEYLQGGGSYSLSVTCVSVWSPSQLKSISWYSEENSCVCLWSLLLVPLLSPIQHLKFWTEKRWDLYRILFNQYLNASYHTDCFQKSSYQIAVVLWVCFFLLPSFITSCFLWKYCSFFFTNHFETGKRLEKHIFCSLNGFLQLVGFSP